MVFSLSNNDFDQITALSLPQINKALNSQWTTRPEFQKLSVKGPHGTLEAKVKSLKVNVIGQTASTRCRLLIGLESGEFCYNTSQSNTVPIDNWTLAWNVDFDFNLLNDSKLSNEIRTKFLQPGDFSDSHLLSLFTLVDLLRFDGQASSFSEHGWKEDSPSNLELILNTYAIDLRERSRHLFDFKPQSIPETKPSTSDVWLVLVPSEDKVYERHVFLYLELSKDVILMPANNSTRVDFSRWVSGALHDLPNSWLGSHGIGTMTINSSKFFGQYIQERSGFVYGAILAMLNANYYSALNNGAPPPSPCEWVLPGRPLGDDWNQWDPLGARTSDWCAWDSTDSKTRYTISWHDYGDGFAAFDPDGKMNGSLAVLPSTNRVQCEWTGSATGTDDNNILREVRIAVTLFISMQPKVGDKGEIQFVAVPMGQQSSGNITKEMSVLDFTKVRDEGISEKLEKQVNDLLVQQVSTLTTRWEVALNFDRKYEIPGGKYFEMTNPMFNETGDLVVVIERKQQV